MRHKMAESHITSATNLGGGYTFQIQLINIYPTQIDMNKQKQQPKNKKGKKALL